MMAWKRLIRFIADDGSIHFGDAIVPKAEANIGKLADEGSLYACVIDTSGSIDIFSANTELTNEVLHVQQLLAPLTRRQVPIIRCIGLNYIKHIQEGGRTPPPYPTLFIKPSMSLAEYGEVITISEFAQETCDYEGELIVVIGQDGKDIPKEHALDYVAGYTAGNDISCRAWQSDPKFVGGAPQWCFSKGLDKYAPIGPAILSQEVIEDAGELILQTRVNGELRQDSNTNDLLFDIPTLISFLSKGTTLEKGSLIMTGTPSGVGMGKKPPVYLKDRDLVEVYIEKIGTLRNTISFG